jgi:hypothetical protein
MQGLNRQAILVDKGIAQSLEPFIAKEANFAKDGYHQAMLDLGTFNNAVYGLPFSISLPVGYYNMEVMAKAGITDAADLPSTWDEVIATCGKLTEAGVDNPMFWGWNITGNWFLQALMWSQDTPTVNGNDFNLDSPEGLKALEQVNALFDGCDMQNIDWKAALASFSAGEIGMMFWSTSPRLRRIFAVTAPSTTARTARPRRFLPARSTAMMSPSRMPTSQRQSPSTRHQKVEAGWRTTHAIGSISSSRSSPAGEGNPALTGTVANRIGKPLAMTGWSMRCTGIGIPNCS